MITIKPEDIINRTYLTPPDEKGQQFRAQIVQKIVEHEAGLEVEPERVKFLVRVEGTKADEIVTYNDIINYLEEQMSDDSSEQLWKFKDIIAHEGPLSHDSPRQLQGIFAANCPVVCAIYAKRMGLLDLPGWKQFKTITKREQKMLRMVNQAKLSAF
jgi:hypothetical protein